MGSRRSAGSGGKTARRKFTSWVRRAAATGTATDWVIRARHTVDAHSYIQQRRIRSPCLSLGDSRESRVRPLCRLSQSEGRRLRRRRQEHVHPTRVRKAATNSDLTRKKGVGEPCDCPAKVETAPKDYDLKMALSKIEALTGVIRAQEEIETLLGRELDELKTKHARNRESVWRLLTRYIHRVSRGAWNCLGTKRDSTPWFGRDLDTGTVSACSRFGRKNRAPGGVVCSQRGATGSREMLGECGHLRLRTVCSWCIHVYSDQLPRLPCVLKRRGTNQFSYLCPNYCVRACTLLCRHTRSEGVLHELQHRIKAQDGDRQDRPPLH